MPHHPERAVAQVLKTASKLTRGHIVVASLSGRDEKDVSQAVKYLLGKSLRRGALPRLPRCLRDASPTGAGGRLHGPGMLTWPPQARLTVIGKYRLHRLNTAFRHFMDGVRP